MAEKYDDVLLPFLTLMRKELHANAGKGDRPGWLAMDANTALLEVYWHVAKLSAAVKNNDGSAIMEHSADVANMAMMVLDVCGGLALVAASPAAAAGVPTGWKLVPREPTPLMVQVAHEAESIMLSGPDIYRAMVLASPVAPVGAPTRPTNEELERLWETTHYGHPADFAADVLERWGGWPKGMLGYGGSQGCELATDATKQLGAQARMPTEADLEQWANSWNASAGEFLEHFLREFCKSNSIHLTAPQNDQDFRRRPASSEAAPSAESREWTPEELAFTAKNFPDALPRNINGETE